MKQFALMTTLALCAALGACASGGTQVSQEAATQFVEGKTTETEIVAKLGKPTSVAISNGARSIGYAGAQYNIKAASFIPIVGLFAGGADVQVTSVVYEIDKSGVLQKIQYITQSTSAQNGLLPAEQKSSTPTAIK